jgi:hypothetical protein
MNLDQVTVVIPTIPPRIKVLQHALISVYEQTHPSCAISIAVDTAKRGAWDTRNRALLNVNPAVSRWVQFLDDDDDLDPTHIEKLLAFAQEHDADYAYSWYRSGINCNPVSDPDREDSLTRAVFGKPFDPEHPHHTGPSPLVRTDLAQRVLYTPPPTDDPTSAVAGNEDWRFTLDCLAQGAKIVHLPEKTWTHHCFPGGTLGLPSRW